MVSKYSVILRPWEITAEKMFMKFEILHGRNYDFEFSFMKMSMETKFENQDFNQAKIRIS